MGTILRQNRSRIKPGGGKERASVGKMQYPQERRKAVDRKGAKSANRTQRSDFAIEAGPGLVPFFRFSLRPLCVLCAFAV
jgi:hypothetical protein